MRNTTMNSAKMQLMLLTIFQILPTTQSFSFTNSIEINSNPIHIQAQQQAPTTRRKIIQPSSSSLYNTFDSEAENTSNNNEDKTTNDFNPSTSDPGDQVRLANNIRPSLNPSVINTISTALLQRSTTRSSFIINKEENTPINIMIEAAALASKTIQSRTQGSQHVTGDNGAFNEEESKLVAGRVVGVLMRLQDLEEDLIQKVKDVPWVNKYGEEATFGVCKLELDDEYNYDDDEKMKQVLKLLEDDPLLRMNRAESLYALFLRNVEMPSMEKAGQIPVDSANAGGNGGGIDFLDQDRLEALFPAGFE